MQNRTELELTEVVGVYERGEAAGANRGVRFGVVIGVLITLTVVCLLFAVLGATGRIQILPPPGAAPTGPIGEPPSGVVPPLTAGSTAAPPLTALGGRIEPPTTGGPAAPLNAPIRGLRLAPPPSDPAPGPPPGAGTR